MIKYYATKLITSKKEIVLLNKCNFKNFTCGDIVYNENGEALYKFDFMIADANSWNSDGYLVKLIKL